MPPSARRDPGAVAEPPAGLLHDRLNRGEVPERDADGVDGAVHGPFGHEHVGPEVPVAAGVPGRRRERRDRLLEREREHGILDRRTAETRMRSSFAHAPPPRSACQRRWSAGAETTPSRSTPSSSSAISVAQTGMPRE